MRTRPFSATHLTKVHSQLCDENKDARMKTLRAMEPEYAAASERAQLVLEAHSTVVYIYYESIGSPHIRPIWHW